MSERWTFNPIEENVNNEPLELSGDRFGHGIFIRPKGVSVPPAPEDVHTATSVDTEGGQAVATTLGVRPGPVLQIQVLEPTDPADTNLMLNPQIAQSGNGTAYYSENAATGTRIQAIIRDLVGFDYALLQSSPGTNANEGIVTNALNATSGLTYTAGVWLKGAAGGEVVKINLNDGVGTTTNTVTLTTSWKWFTVTRAFTSTTASVAVIANTTTAMSFYATGFALVQDTALTEYFDGTFPGCAWTGTPHNSTSTRPATGGPRMSAIMADVERQVTRVSQDRAGTLRRTVNGKRVTFDLINAQLNWDDTQMINAGVAYGTITCQSEPFARGPEVTTFAESQFLAVNYTADSGTISNFTISGSTLTSSLNLTTENRLLYSGGQYPFYVGEVSASFTPGATISGFKAGVIVERIDARNYIEAYVTDNGTNSLLNIDKVVGGTRTNVSTTTLAARIVASSLFTVRARVQRVNNQDLVYAEYFTGSPATVSSSPTNAPAAYAITDTTVFSTLTPGFVGFVINPQATGAIVQGFVITPYLARERAAGALRFGATGIPGDAPALGRLDVNDLSGNDQWWCRWGVQADRLGRMSSTSALFLEAESLTLLNGATVQNGAAPSSPGGTNNAVQASGLTSAMKAVLSTKIGSNFLSHTGYFQVYARASAATSAGSNIALSWSVGDLIQFTTNNTVTLGASWTLVDLGQIFIPTVTLGTQQWQGQIMASSSSGGGVWLDFLMFVPLQRAGIIKGITQPVGFSSITASDVFNQTTGVNLGGQTASVGGTWTTVGGSATDYTVNTGGNPGGGAQRSTSGESGDLTAGRWAVLGSVQTGSIVQVDYIHNTNSGGSQDFATISGVVARYSNNTNYMIAYVYGANAANGGSGWRVYTVVSGTATLLASGNYTPSSTWSTLQLLVDSAGRWTFSWGPAGGALLAFASGQSTVLAPGGSLASGSCGIYDLSNNSGITRVYDNFTVSTYSNDAAFYAGNALEIRSDRALRQQSGASPTVWAPPGSYTGDYLTIPNVSYADGFANFIVKASRNDLLRSDAGIDAIQAQLSITPRYHDIPDA